MRQILAGYLGAIALSQKKTSIYNDVDRGDPINVCQCFRILRGLYENQTSAMTILRNPIAPDTGGLSGAIVVSQKKTNIYNERTEVVL